MCDMYLMQGVASTVKRIYVVRRMKTARITTLNPHEQEPFLIFNSPKEGSRFLLLISLYRLNRLLGIDFYGLGI